MGASYPRTENRTAFSGNFQDQEKVKHWLTTSYGPLVDPSNTKNKQRLYKLQYPTLNMKVNSGSKANEHIWYSPLTGESGWVGSDSVGRGMPPLKGGGYFGRIWGNVLRPKLTEGFVKIYKPR